MDKRSQRLAKNKTDLIPKNASCKRWDTPKTTVLSSRRRADHPCRFRGRSPVIRLWGPPVTWCRPSDWPDGAPRSCYPR